MELIQFEFIFSWQVQFPTCKVVYTKYYKQLFMKAFRQRPVEDWLFGHLTLIDMRSDTFISLSCLDYILSAEFL